MPVIPRGIQSGVVIQGGKLRWRTINAETPLDWASCARAVIADTCWPHAISAGLIPRERLDQPAIFLGSRTAMTLPSHLTLWEVLSYIGANGRWHYSNHWRIMDDVFYEITNWRMHDYFNTFLGPLLPGITAKENAEDGTPRFRASAHDAAKWGYAALHQGLDITPDLWERMQTPVEDPWEGIGGMHLIREGVAWELNLEGVPDGFMARDGGEDEDHGHGAIVVLPSLDAVIAVRGASPEWWLPTICRNLR
jgi:hypothetical protein